MCGIFLITYYFSVLTAEERRRLEDKIRRLEEELEEEQASNETANDKWRKAQIQVNIFY